jgi:hypothetical protein
MTGLEALQAVQFVTVHGRRLSVLSAEDWESLVDGWRRWNTSASRKWLSAPFRPPGAIVAKQAGSAGTT